MQQVKLTSPRRAPKSILRNQTGLASSVRSLRIGFILVPVDFSPPSQYALRYAAQLAQACGARLLLVHVNETITVTNLAHTPLFRDHDEVLAEAKERLHAFWAAEGLDRGLIERESVRNGLVFEEITRAASSLKADLIVIATHGYTGVKRALLGSTAERVVRHAPCPVLVVREPTIQSA